MSHYVVLHNASLSTRRREAAVAPYEFHTTPVPSPPPCYLPIVFMNRIIDESFVYINEHIDGFQSANALLSNGPMLTWNVTGTK